MNFLTLVDWLAIIGGAMGGILMIAAYIYRANRRSKAKYEDFRRKHSRSESYHHV